VIGAVVIPYVARERRKERTAREKFDASKISGLAAATTMHPHIDALQCIGCGSCTRVCPEGDVLAVVDGTATLIHGSKCVGHGLCAEACPVGAITLMMAPPGKSANLPVLSPDNETTVPHIYVAGELGGMGLIKNAIRQGKSVVDHIAATRNGPSKTPFDVAIVGAGPAGLAAALSAKQHNLRYILLEQGDVGGTILQYPRKKLVLTSPVELPLWGRLKFNEISKESLLELWQDVIDKTKLHVRTGEKVVEILPTPSGIHVRTLWNSYDAANVVLALGRRGTPRKLDVPGEDLAKVMYRMIDTASYQNCDALVVGGGDSAVEAAVGLALQGTNRVTISYRKDSFGRIKERNRVHLDDYVRRKAIRLALNTNVKEIRPDSVILDTPDGPRSLNNNYVFIFAGGEMPFEFLKQIGIQFQAQEISAAEARAA
jgi:putative YpdA family bacillithiol system oxidoreductase